MTSTVRIAVSIQKAISDQAKTLARQLNVSRSRLFEIAIEQFTRNYQGQSIHNEMSEVAEDRTDLDDRAKALHQNMPKLVNQGDVYWVPLKGPDHMETYYIHPHVIIQDNVLNHSRINTVVVCALTSNRKRAKAPGNVLLEAGEANLPKPSIVVVSQVSAVDKMQLGEYIGSLSRQRVDQILSGMRFLQLMTGSRKTSGEAK